MMEAAEAERKVERALARAQARRATQEQRRRCWRAAQALALATAAVAVVGVVELPSSSPSATSSTHRCTEVQGCRAMLHEAHQALAWQKLDRLRLRHQLAHAAQLTGPHYAIRLAALTYHVPEAEMRAVAGCESHMSPTAHNSSGASGLFQFLPSTWAHTPYRAASVYDPAANALAAAWLVQQDGGWSEWVCQP